MMSAPRWWVDLARYSTFEQVRGDVNIGERQHAINRATAERNGLHIGRTYTAVDVSGGHTSDDPIFQQVFRDMKDPNCEGVLMPEQSRLFRPDDNKDYAILDHFKQNRKILYLPNGPKRLWIPQDALEVRIKAAIDGNELATLKERTMTGREQKRINGQHPGGNHMLPAGIKYKRIRNDNGRVIREFWMVQDGVYDQVRRRHCQLERTRNN